MRPFGRHGVSMADTERKPAGEHGPFWENEAFWRGAAFAVPVIVGTGMLGGLVPTFFGPEEGLAERSEIYGRFALIGVAIVTFTTVMWRGMIATRQADSQERQLENFNKQFAKAGDDTLATLFQNGAEMLAEDKPAKQSAGIATLHTVAAGENERLAVAAMNVLADFVQDNGATSHDDRIVKHAIYTLNIVAVEQGRFAARELTFTSDGPGAEHALWIGILGSKVANYEGGGFILQDFSGAPVECHIKASNTIFSRCKGIIFANSHQSNCIFSNCKIEMFRKDKYDFNNSFIECDFSRTIFPDGIIERIDGKDNFFRDNEPPIVFVDGRYATLANPPSWLDRKADSHQKQLNEKYLATEHAMARNTFGSYPRWLGTEETDDG